MNIIIITGASSGIGREFARQMDGIFPSVDEFWLVARSGDRLKELADSLKHKCRIFAMDVTEDERLEELEEAVIGRNAVVRVLVNCAGYGILGPFAEQKRESELGMVRLNCEALTNITHRMIPYMKRGSRIIQMASCAAFLPQSDFAVYAASKAYVLRFSQALREELKKKEIYVTSVCPGPVDTPFFDIAEKTGRMLSVKKYFMVKADRVVAKALRDSYEKKSKSVYSLPVKGIGAIAKILPHEFALSVMSKMKI